MAEEATPTPTETVLNQPSPETPTETPTSDPPVGTPEQETPKPTEGSADADKKVDEPQGAPEEYDEFSVPEGMELDKEAIQQFTPLAKELNLSQEDAQKLIDFDIKRRQEDVTASQERWDTLKADWAKSAQSDEEFGGQAFEANVGLAKQALDQFGTPELKEALEVTGTGSHPEIVRFFYRVGKSLKEADMLQGSAPAKDTRSAAQKIFTTMEK